MLLGPLNSCTYINYKLHYLFDILNEYFTIYLSIIIVITTTRDVYFFVIDFPRLDLINWLFRWFIKVVQLTFRWGRNARWTTSRTRTRPGWIACRSGTGTSSVCRLCRNSASSGIAFPGRRRSRGTVARRSRSSCRAPCPAPGNRFRAYLEK